MRGGASGTPPMPDESAVAASTALSLYGALPTVTGDLARVVMDAIDPAVEECEHPSKC